MSVIRPFRNRRHPVPRPLAFTLIAGGLALASIGLAAVADATPTAQAQVATLGTPPPSPQASTTPTPESSAEDSLIAYAACMREHGIETDDPQFDVNGNLVSKPEGSATALQSPDQPTASFVADVDGTFVASLIVNDGIVDSEPSNASILASFSQDQAVHTIDDTIELINGLPRDVFKNKNMGRTLTNKLLAVIGLIESGDYDQARSKLMNDVMRKTDGCAVAGAPDRNDWIETCEAQGQVHTLLLEIQTILDELIGP